MLKDNILAFKELGLHLTDHQWVENTFGEAIERQYRENSWFTPEFCRYSLSAIAQMLASEALDAYYARYQYVAPTIAPRKRIAVISVGDIPLADFHDFFCILVSGNDFLGKLSIHEKYLLPALAKEIVSIEPAFEERIDFVEKVTDFDAIIATESNNNSRYFDYYFGKYPHILRKNRNSVAVLNEKESDDELRALANDFVPFLQILTQESQPIAQHHQFNNNLEYQKAVHLMNQIPYMDAGTFLLVENQNYASPIGMIYYEFYDDIEVVNRRLNADSELLQCIVSNDPRITRAEPFGSAQSPTLSDYPDGIDTLRWMLAIGC